MSLLWPIVRNAISSSSRPAVIDDRRTYSYGELIGGALHLADQIEAATQNPHVGIMLPTSGAFPIALMGAWFARRAAVPLNYLLAEDELAYVIKDSGIDTLITVGPMLDFVGGAEKIPRGVNLMMLDKIKFEGLPPLRWPPYAHPDDLAVLLYTSGTSGRPKGVMLTHGNLQSNVSGCIEHANISDADTFLGVLPQFHSFGLTGLTLLPLAVGCTIVYSARFLPKRIVKLIREHKPCITMAVPSMYGTLLSVKDATPDDFASVRIPISGGEPLPDATYEAFKQKFAVRLLEGYGLTETSPVACWCTPDMRKRHSVGTPLPDVEFCIVDNDDQPLPTGEEGEILITGPNIMAGYYNLPKATAEAIDQLPHPDTGRDTRYFRSGDIGKLDEDGFLYLTGRKKEMLIIAGENVFPREIEEVLNRHDTVAASAVIGKTDGMRGEVPIAFVELVEDAAFDDTALRAHCRDNLAQFKVPREIRHLDELPRNPTGKIMRRHLEP